MKIYKTIPLFFIVFFICCSGGKIIGDRVIYESKYFECGLLDDDWELRLHETERQEHAALHFKNKKDGTWITIFHVKLRERNKYDDATDLLTGHIQKLEGLRENLKLLSIGDIDIAQVKAKWAIVEYDHRETRLKMKAKITDFGYKGWSYSLYLFSKKENFDKHLLVYDQFVKSFKLIKK